MLSKTIEDYCRLIDKLDSGEGVRSRRISEGLGLSKNTVAITLQKLAKANFVKMQRYGRVRLAARGLKIANAMNFKHRVLEVFLFSKLGIGQKEIHGEASVLEHAASDKMIKKLYIFMGKPPHDPHGRRISK